MTAAPTTCKARIRHQNRTYACTRKAGHQDLHAYDDPDEKLEPVRWHTLPPMCKADMSLGVTQWKCELSHGHAGPHRGTSDWVSSNHPDYKQEWETFDE